MSFGLSKKMVDSINSDKINRYVDRAFDAAKRRCEIVMEKHIGNPQVAIDELKERLGILIERQSHADETMISPEQIYTLLEIEEIESIVKPNHS